MIAPDRCRVGDGFESRPNAVSQLKKLEIAPNAPISDAGGMAWLQKQAQLIVMHS